MILNRYFLKSIFSYTLTISLIFILIIVSSRSIQYLEQASRGEISPEIVFSIVLLRLPEFLELILPLGFFLSIILSISKFRAESEFVIMEQSGFSLARVYYLLTIPALIICTMLVYFSTVLSPSFELRVSNLLEVRTLEERFKSLTPGKFHKLNDEILLFAKGKDKNNLTDVFLKINDLEVNSNNVIVAKRVNITELEKIFLNFEEGYFFSETKPDQFMSVQFDKLSLVNKSLDNARNRSHSEESTKPFIWSISIIFMTVLSMFIAVPISKISPRKGRYSRVLPGLLIFLTYTGLLLSFKGNEVTEITSMMLTHFIFLVLAVILNFYSLKVYK
ncbi:LptF/LptG family permease [Gammaproteobacteria bacterium]|nr:LptF/LptG family permease [Gammaproteobacteria bacterium]